MFSLFRTIHYQIINHLYDAMRVSVVVWWLMLISFQSYAQVLINEGSNRNYLSIQDEDGEYPDWVELYNSSQDTVLLFNYSLTDKQSEPTRWTFPAVKLAPGEFKTVFCSGKDRKPVSNFVHVLNTGNFIPGTGWITHSFTTPFHWDGVSNLLINICSYCSTGYTSNSVFRQHETSFNSVLYYFEDGGDAACGHSMGTVSTHRPNVQINGFQIGNGTWQNSGTEYPAPYGNWYWGARHQILFRADELLAAGLTAGDLNSLAFEVVQSGSNTVYDYIEFHCKAVSEQELTTSFSSLNTQNYLHTNFKIDSDGEKVYLFTPQQIQANNLLINNKDLDQSVGLLPDGSSTATLFAGVTPGASNNASQAYSSYLLASTHSHPSGMYDAPIQVSLDNPNPAPSQLYYTLDGTEPGPTSLLYNGTPIEIYTSSVLKSRAYQEGFLPGPICVSSYLMGVHHATPVLSVVTSPNNLYGSAGIFDNWSEDWERTAYVEYFSEDENLIFSQRAGIQIDGGAGGSRSHPQHSFRVELDDGVLGEGPIYYPLIPNRPNRSKYSKFYLRNGSNQYLVLPYKDACQVQILGNETNTYYSAMRPVSVYINGNYFGLYELREKFDTEYFAVLEGADEDSIDILSQSYWYGGMLRATIGSVEPFWEDVTKINNLDPQTSDFMQRADSLVDIKWYIDYIIAENWIANNDWPYNNIKIYRSNTTQFKWRYCLIDVELSLAPNSWTDCYYDHFNLLYDQGNTHPYVGLWIRGMEHVPFKNYFINRYADVMNTSYQPERALEQESQFFNFTAVEMQNEYQRWGNAGDIPGEMNSFYNNHLTFRDQLSLRTDVVREQIRS
ncbi:MAG: CotH kinase family protein, partial [Bacteroidales bacterium]|nr:CotH kinase family protein [Bacteroidales bacterium]